jgi:hypothetical protein
MADSELSRLASEISELSSALTAETVDVDSIIGNFEGVLRRLNAAGLTVEVPLWDNPPPRVTRRVRLKEVVTRREIALVFAPSESEWRLQVRRDIYVDEGHQFLSPLAWTQAPRPKLLETTMSRLVTESPRTKIQALRKFRPLLEELKLRVQADLEAIRNAKKLTE